jgi:hypothetical protein
VERKNHGWGLVGVEEIKMGYRANARLVISSFIEIAVRKG